MKGDHDHFHCLHNPIKRSSFRMSTGKSYKTDYYLVSIQLFIIKAFKKTYVTHAIFNYKNRILQS